MAKGNALKIKVVSETYRTLAASKPASVFIALFTVAQDDAGTGGTEVTGGNYARKEVANLDANWTDNGDGTVENTAETTFAAPNADWGQVVGFASYSSLAGGAADLLGINPNTLRNRMNKLGIDYKRRSEN